MVETATESARKKRSRPPGAGRKKGTLNKATREIKELARELTLGNAAVLARPTRECADGSIHPRIFTELLHYGYGRPREQEPEKGPGKALIFAMMHPPGA